MKNLGIITPPLRLSDACEWEAIQFFMIIDGCLWFMGELVTM
jgi:hypothetical protein